MLRFVSTQWRSGGGGAVESGAAGLGDKMYILNLKKNLPGLSDFKLFTNVQRQCFVEVHVFCYGRPLWLLAYVPLSTHPE
jgi:hypothetical protein